MPISISNSDLDSVCKPLWEQAIAEDPEITQDCSFEEYKDEVRMEIELLIERGMIKET